MEQTGSVLRNRRGMQMWSMRRLIEEGIHTPAEVSIDYLRNVRW